MPIEIIPKPAVKPLFWLNILFYFSLALVLATIPSYFILKNFQKKASQTIEEIKADIKAASTPQQLALEEELENKKKKIDDFSVLISGHQLNSKIFPLIEKATHPKVFFSSFNLNSKELNSALTGQTESFQTLGQQIYILKKVKGIQKISLSRVSIGREGQITFTLSLSLEPKIFR